MAGGHAWQGGMLGRGYVCGRGMHSGGEAYVAGGVRGGVHAWWGCAWQGGRAWQERRPLQRTVRILLECILVKGAFTLR